MTLSRLKLTVLGMAFAALLAVPAAQASTIAVNFTNTTTASSLGNPPFTLGWSFTALDDIVVTDLGLFDSSQDGLIDRYMIGLWDSGGNLLVSTVLPNGTAAALDDKFRFQSVTSTILTTGQTYFIGALFTTGNDPVLAPGDAAGFVTAPQISFLNNQWAFGGSLTFPSGSFGTDPAIFGPNFRYAPVPEPASLLLLGVGLAPFAVRAYRRKAQ